MNYLTEDERKRYECTNRNQHAENRHINNEINRIYYNTKSFDLHHIPINHCGLQERVRVAKTK